MARLVRVGTALCAIGLLLTGCDGTVARRDVSHASPLAEFLGSPVRSHLGLPHLDEHERERQDRHTELVAECMRQAGFEYVVVSVAERLGPQFLAAYETDPDDFAERYGYGVTTIEVADYVDPNQQLREQLSPQRQTEYDRQLWGGSGPAAGSCYQQATDQVYGNPGDRAEGFASFAGLLEQVNELYHSIDTDPRLRDAHRAWAECLALAGYPGFAAPPDARRSVFARLPAGQPGGPAGQPDPPAGEPGEPAAEQPGDPPAEQPGGPAAGQPEPDPHLVAEVREYELALAPVDRECQRRHVDGPRRLVTLERERAFITEHREELERYRDFLTAD